MSTCKSRKQLISQCFDCANGVNFSFVIAARGRISATSIIKESYRPKLSASNSSRDAPCSKSGQKCFVMVGWRVNNRREP